MTLTQTDEIGRGKGGRQMGFRGPTQLAELAEDQV